MKETNYVDSMTDEERKEQAEIQKSVVVTTAGGEEPTVIVASKKTATETIVEEKKLSPDEIRNELLSKIVKPHTNKSRLVVESDIPRIIEDAQTLYGICMISAYAMHHSQINTEDPLNYFVTNQREIIINPVIVRHSNYTVDSKEACMSKMGMEKVTVQRWQKCEVTYQTIMVDPEDKDKFKLSSLIEESVSGPRSFIFGHEIDHGNAIFIFPFFDGTMV